MRSGSPKKLPYFLFGAGCTLFALVAGWLPMSSRINNYHYDWLLWLYKPNKPAQESVVVEFDELTFMKYKGLRRSTLAKTLEMIARVKPKAVAIDLILSDESENAEDDRLLAEAMKKVPNLILSSDIIVNAGVWEEPLPIFAKAAKVVGHVHASPDQYDGVCRQVQLEKAAQRKRKWALALEAYRLAQGGVQIVESDRDLRIGDVVLPYGHQSEGRPMFIRYRFNENVRNAIPRISVKNLLEDASKAEQLRNKVVFIGVTALSASRDRLVTPYRTAEVMPGVEIHAHVYETLAQHDLLFQAGPLTNIIVCITLAMTCSLIFAFLGGWPAYLFGVFQIIVAHSLPHFAFLTAAVFPIVSPALAAWLTVICCSAWQHFVVRRQLVISEEGRSRYQQAIHFVSHEMRSPLTAIQGSSELMTRYNLSDEKRKQIAQMINAESKRLAKMIQTFLDVERLGAGQMELKREPFPILDTVIICAERARPLAERKKIGMEVGELAEADVFGDRELMEYAVYNLLTNAIKYSPPETAVNVQATMDSGKLRIAVRDQGIGMDAKELKKIGTKFYRTKSAEKSGEVGTGIGLSIVSEIVRHHGGAMEVSSAPGKGSCFTIVVPAAIAAKSGEGK